MKKSVLIAFVGLAVAISSCVKDDDNTGAPNVQDVDLSGISYNPVAFEYVVPDHFSPMPQPENNLATEAGLALGRHLFFDPILSRDSTISCSSCHFPHLAFTDGVAFSKGIDNQRTLRSSMSLVNVGYQTSYVWDGRSGTLEDQSLHPIEDPREMDADWSDIELRLQTSTKYQEMFRKAFGIDRSSEITRTLAAKAIAQFERAIISGDSKWDRVTYELDGFFSTLEEDGRQLFFTEPTVDHPGCGHCHNAPFYFDNRFLNNGLDSAESLADFPDLGRGAVTGNEYDNGKFRSPTLRNIALTAPYMHDGRFETLEEVIDHYASGGHFSPTLDPNITGFSLTEREKQALVAFLHTLTDTTSMQMPYLLPPQ